ncbi:MAG: 16S rRNA (cytosine(1402)-N(4))-methyltransferase RsmH [Oscillospiraceae bacterium]|jgi:16S rRNA (cytosine1402-N4)-methyltransferase|nr:16S rRNA (cytosine(1402)-N(4))-methyltransferase RsmH [Oscillospiraceae bacterium]
MQFDHKPVLLRETLANLAPRPGGVYVDGTLGGGGHSQAILRAIQPGGLLFGIDRDDAAIRAATECLAGLPGFTPIRGNFHDVTALLAACGVAAIDGMLLDLGVSSYQLDTAGRGFSFHQDAPLDMRMDQRQTLDAAVILNTWDEAALAGILRDYGEEPWAVRIAKIALERRARAPLATTGELVALVDAAIPKKVRERTEGHPARRAFQALRIAVNDELAPLRAALEDAAALLAPGGRLCVITFHSLEDRIVKQTFRALQNPCVCPPKAPICTCGRVPSVRVIGGNGFTPGQDELAENPRARSARLRVAEKL